MNLNKTVAKTWANIKIRYRWIVETLIVLTKLFKLIIYLAFSKKINAAGDLLQVRKTDVDDGDNQIYQS